MYGSGEISKDDGKRNMSRNESYKEDPLADLRSNLEYAAEYLSAAYADSPEAFLVALRDVTEAQQGMANVAKQARVNRENLYRTLSERGNPTLNTVGSVLEALGITVKFEPKETGPQLRQRRRQLQRRIRRVSAA
jgi:probable addiction module antidote protein